MDGFTRLAVNVLSFLIIQQTCVLHAAGVCPKNFTSVDKYCYLLKDPEIFSDKFSNCPGNLFSLELIESLRLPDPDVPFWTDYTSLFPGSVSLLDWSYTNSTGTLLDTASIELEWAHMTADDVTCVIRVSFRSFLVKCNELHYRYCIVEADADARKYKKVTLTLTAMEYDNIIQLNVDYPTPRKIGDPTLDQEHIMCFTDSSEYFPQRVRISGTGPYFVSPTEDGYYWCTHSDSKNFFKTESQKVLYVKNKRDLPNTYAVKIKWYGNLLNKDGVVERMFRAMIKILDNYVHFSTEYRKSTKKINYNINDVFEFARKHRSTHIMSYGVVLKAKLKRLYEDYLIGHVTLKEHLEPVQPGRWHDTLIYYMKPVYFCDREKKIRLDRIRVEPPCTLVKCKGDFNEGVEMTTTSLEVCVAPPIRLLPTTTQLPQLPTTTSRATNSIEPKNLDLMDVITEMEKLINSTDFFTMDDFRDVFYRIDAILFREELEVNGHFLKLLEEIGAGIDLNGSLVLKAVGKNIALLVTEASPREPVRVFRVANRDTGFFDIDAFEFFHTDINSSLISESQIVVILPYSVSDIKRRVSFLIFRKDHPFQEKNKNYEVNSRVVSVKVEYFTKFVQEETIDIYMKPLKPKQKRSQNRTCAFWKFHDDDTGSWSQEGCNFTRASEIHQLDMCRCNHLTHFAEILIPRANISKTHEDALENLSIMGCSISILGLLLVSLTAALFRSWRRDFTNKIWLQLSISIIILCFCFLIKVFIQFVEDDWYCPLTGTMLHYSVLSSFCWMLVAAVVSYRKLVAVLSMDPTHKLLRASAYAWGVPFAVISILWSVDPHSYKYDEYLAFCYPSGLAIWIAVYTPIALMLLSNLTLYVLIMRSVFGKYRPQYHRQNEAKEAIRCASVSCLLVFLLGLPWLFGLLSYNIVCDYLFTIFVTFQGFILCFFFVGKKSTRDLWLAMLKMKRIGDSTAGKVYVDSYHFKAKASALRQL